MSYDNNMTGALFPNDKGDNPKRPDMRGPVEIDGKKYWISAWTRTGDKGKLTGKKYLSLKVQPDEQQPARAADFPATASARPRTHSLPDQTPQDDDGGSLPF